ncbi:Kremen protein 1 [Desmophyllum pertusum]|uniref:Kremen protein 1 n=1 Tax=Desmophyllum pertusum TaxID=174260 RepID=A0A9W9YM51_9CNID|nr:Kremen protein 1 [Desmophyllum pertusum]
MLLPRISGLILGVFALIGLTYSFTAYTEKVDINPELIGCYNDDKVLDDDYRLVKPRALGLEVGHFTSKQDCVDQCGDKGFLYAGLQNGDLCFCGNTYDEYGRADDKECNIKCRTRMFRLNTLITSSSRVAEGGGMPYTPLLVLNPRSARLL